MGKQCGETFAYKHVLRRHCINVHSAWSTSPAGGPQGPPNVQSSASSAHILRNDASDGRGNAVITSPASSSDTHAMGAASSTGRFIEISTSASSSSQREAVGFFT